MDVFTGPITARLEGPAPHTCGRERPPITTLELGPRGHSDPLRVGREHGDPAQRRSSESGRSSESLEHGGDEQEWQDRLMSASGGDDSRGALYVAAAAVEHRRAGRDARLRALSRAAYARGRAARRFDACGRQGARR